MPRFLLSCPELDILKNYAASTLAKKMSGAVTLSELNIMKVGQTLRTHPLAVSEPRWKITRLA